MYLEAFEGPSEAAPSKKMKTRQLKIDVIVQNRRGKSGQEMIPFLIFFFCFVFVWNVFWQAKDEKVGMCGRVSVVRLGKVMAYIWE